MHPHRPVHIVMGQRVTKLDRGTILVATLVVITLAGVACSSLLLLTDVSIRSQRAIQRRQSVRASTDSALTFAEAIARRALETDPSSCPHIPERTNTTSLDPACRGSSLRFPLQFMALSWTPSPTRHGPSVSNRRRRAPSWSIPERSNPPVCPSSPIVFE